MKQQCLHRGNVVGKMLYGGEGPDDAAESLKCMQCGATGWRYCDGEEGWHETDGGFRLRGRGFERKRRRRADLHWRMLQLLQAGCIGFVCGLPNDTEAQRNRLGWWLLITFAVATATYLYTQFVFLKTKPCPECDR